MTSKECFIELVQLVFDHIDISTFVGEDENALTGLKYFEDFKLAKKESVEMTDLGLKILTALNELDKPSTANELGEKIFASGRSVSGSIKKLYTDGYCIKDESKPIKYTITEKGKQYFIDKN